MMDLNYLKKLLKIFDDSMASELTIEEEGIKLKLSKSSKESSKAQQQMPYINMPSFMQPAMQQPAPQPLTPVTETHQPQVVGAKIEQPKVEESDGMHKINSPIVGTFYRSPSPDAPPFVEVGTHVVPGQTLCIIEAMKLMNEIESDIAGTITKIAVQNSQPVEYNQSLFIIKPD